MGIERQAVVLYRAKNLGSVRLGLANVVSAVLGKWPTIRGGCPMACLEQPIVSVSQCTA